MTTDSGGYAVPAAAREELAALESGTTVAVAVVLRAMGIHAVDSRPRAFHHAGRLAFRNALALARPPAAPTGFRRSPQS
ncbi:hypothetical protein ACH4Q7_33725 [Streptomyces roseolus]|uniref:hypothetical protein n=1 Tax=Streptomyces roseolus TaxID=67358 RepID=UPI0037BB441B